MEWVKADDGNDRLFSALTEHPNPPEDEKVKVWVFFDKENGWGENVGSVGMKHLKRDSNTGHFFE